MWLTWLFISGKPLHWNAWNRGKISWHPSAAQFCGAGITESGALFSYHADWEGPGRWGVEVVTRKRRYILKPMETLQIINLASIKPEQLNLNDTLDRSFKPGLHRRTESFLDGQTELLCSLDEQSQMISVYSKMAGYNSVMAKND